MLEFLACVRRNLGAPRGMAVQTDGREGAAGAVSNYRPCRYHTWLGSVESRMVRTGAWGRQVWATPGSCCAGCYVSKCLHRSSPCIVGFASRGRVPRIVLAAHIPLAACANRTCAPQPQRMDSQAHPLRRPCPTVSLSCALTPFIPSWATLDTRCGAFLVGAGPRVVKGGDCRQLRSPPCPALPLQCSP